MNKSRPNKITFRLSDTELKAFKQRVEKSGYNNQQFLAKVIFQKPVIEKEAVKALMFELKKQGVNLNQIARSCNSGNTELEKQRILQTIQNLEVIYGRIQSY
jgi:hypothetical protein